MSRVVSSKRWFIVSKRAFTSLNCLLTSSNRLSTFSNRRFISLFIVSNRRFISLFMSSMRLFWSFMRDNSMNMPPICAPSSVRNARKRVIVSRVRASMLGAFPGSVAPLSVLGQT